MGREACERLSVQNFLFAHPHSFRSLSMQNHVRKARKFLAGVRAEPLTAITKMLIPSYFFALLMMRVRTFHELRARVIIHACCRTIALPRITTRSLTRFVKR